MKTLLNKIKSIYEEVYRRYCFTMILVDITVIAAIAYIISDNYSSVGEWICLFFLFWSFGSFCSENFPKKILTGVGIAATGIISAVLVSLNTNYIFGYFNLDAVKINDNRLMAFNLAYFILIVLSSFYLKYKEQRNTEDGQELEDYFVHVFIEILQTCIAWAILAVGFLILSFVFETLIDVVVGEVEIPQILILGLFAAPKVFMSLTPSKEEIGKFFEILIKYVLLIITIVGAAIIYLYMIKTVFTGIPSNEIFGISSALFFVAIPVGYACTAFDKDSFLQKIAYVLPYIYAPFIILQAYSIIVRIADYGITPSRYAGLVLIILEILYIVFYAFFRKHIDKLILVMMCITVLTTIVPGINAVDFSRISQKSILIDFAKNGMPISDEGKKKLIGAYKYILKDCNEAYLDKLLDKELQNQINEIDLNRNTIDIYGMRSNIHVIPTDGFDYVAEFNSTCDSFDGKAAAENMNIKVNGKSVATYDFTEEYKSVIRRNKDNGNRFIDGPEVLMISDDCKLIVTDMTITADKTDDTLVELRVYGYILMSQDFVDELNLAGLLL